MKEIRIPAFDEATFFDEVENKNSRVITFEGADRASFDRYCELFLSEGFAKKETRDNGCNSYAAFLDGSVGVFISFFGAIGELSIVIETDCRYFDYSDTSADASVTPQITQIALEDFGMSYAIRLSDGRFIIIDGGREFEIDADKLYKRIKSDSPFDIPVIAAWIMTHPHSDHFFCFIPFMDKYGDKVKIEKFIFNFPEADDLAHYPKLAERDSRSDYDDSSSAFIPLMLERIEKTGADVYTAHTGQTYKIGDAVCRILSCMDNTIHLSDNINAASLVIRMELAGQTILWTTDASFSKAKLPERYDDYLKADILQVPHHGFQCGDAASEAAGYDIIKPGICLLPAIDYNAYSFFCIHREGTRHLYELECVREVITGDLERTITLPYTAPAEAKKKHENKVTLGLESGGAKVWIFTELNTSEPEDLVFTILNATIIKAEVWIELLFENNKDTVRFIKAEVDGGSIRRLCIVGDEVDGDARYYNWESLKLKGIPEGVPFAARFMCNSPIVVSNKKHSATYHTNAI